MAPLALAVLAVSLAAAGDSSLPPAAPDPTEPGLSGTERLEALIERIKLEQSRMKTLEAHFVQRRDSELLVAPEESRGVFSYAAPDRVRWEYVSPNPISVVIDGREMTTWYRDLGRADRLKIGRYSSQVFKYLGASGSMETLLDYFRVSARFPEKPGEPYRLRLLPKYERISQKLKSMTIWIDPERYLPNRLVYVSSSGDTTEYRFEDFEINGDIPGDRFVLDLPPDVQARDIDLGEGAG
jgi:outer membrane lipoprotein carrier protein